MIIFEPFSSMASKPINILWIKTGSKIMYRIVLQTIFYEYQNRNHNIDTKMNLIFFSLNTRGKLSIIRCDKNY